MGIVAATPAKRTTSQQGNPVDGETYLTLTRSAAYIRPGGQVTFTATLTYYVESPGPVSAGRVANPKAHIVAPDQKVTLIAPDGSTKTGTTNCQGQCTWTETIAAKGTYTYNARFDGGSLRCQTLLPSKSDPINVGVVSGPPQPTITSVTWTPNCGGSVIKGANTMFTVHWVSANPLDPPAHWDVVWDWYYFGDTDGKLEDGAATSSSWEKQYNTGPTQNQNIYVQVCAGSPKDRLCHGINIRVSIVG